MKIRSVKNSCVCLFWRNYFAQQLAGYDGLNVIVEQLSEYEVNVFNADGAFVCTAYRVTPSPVDLARKPQDSVRQVEGESLAKMKQRYLNHQRYKQGMPKKHLNDLLGK